MTDSHSHSTVVAAGKLTDLRERLDRLDAERVCLRITDRYWEVLKARARKSAKPLDVALQSELDRAAHAIREHYTRFVLGKR